MRLSHVLVAACAAAVPLLVTTPASALTTTYEAEDFTSSIVDPGFSIARAANASGLRYVALTRNAAITFSVPTKVRAFYATVRGTSCLKAGEAEAWPTYAFEGYPSYWQEDALFTGGLTAPPPATAVWGGRDGTGFVRVTSPPAGWSAPSMFHPGPARITLRFTNDWKSGPSCDRNLDVDSLTVIS